MKNRTRNERRRARREAVRGVVVTICFLVALFADTPGTKARTSA